MYAGAFGSVSGKLVATVRAGFLKGKRRQLEVGLASRRAWIPGEPAVRNQLLQTAACVIGKPASATKRQSKFCPSPIRQLALEPASTGKFRFVQPLIP